jgi:protein tyrosine phosphatase (PTP) superfamily phosphohydrolase (DUF442 family)
VNATGKQSPDRDGTLEPGRLPFSRKIGGPVRVFAALAIAAPLVAGLTLIGRATKDDPRPTRAPSTAVPTPSPTPSSAPAATAPAAFAPVGNPAHLPNAYRITDTIISGAQPQGGAGFKELADLGVKTVISVDGATPDVDAAKKHGLRYVHLPITYGGVTREQGARIAKALIELPGPIYVHCHHGKHRSAAAVAVACVMNGRIKPEQAEAVLQTFGTGANYHGLWRDARAARPLAPHALDGLRVSYVERAEVPAVAEAMVDIEQTLDNLKLIQKSGWRSPAEHPALEPAHEALQLREKLHEAGRTDDRLTRPGGCERLLHQSEAAVRALEDALRAWKPPALNSGPAQGPPAALDTAFKAVTASCAACHRACRD